MSVGYQLVFTGQLLKGRDPARISEALAQRLRVPSAQIDSWIDKGERKVLARALQVESAERMRLQLAKLGVVTLIESDSGQASQGMPVPAAPANGAAKRPSASAEQGRRYWPWLGRFTPLGLRWLLIPTLLQASLISLLVVLVHGGLILTSLFGVLLPSLTSSWASELLGNPLAGQLLQGVVALLGLLMLGLLLKPLLAIRLPLQHGQPLDSQQEPDLLAYIEDVCERIGAPRPHRVYLVHAPEVSAQYHLGPLGYMQNRIVLRVGMPLLAGMNTRQMAAQIAMAMSRFRTGQLPWANSLVLGTQSWLLAALNNPDPIDRLLVQRLRSGSGAALWRLAEWLAGLARWPVRGWLWITQLVAHKPVHSLVATGDRLGLTLSGSDGFRQILARNALLEQAQLQLMESLANKWQKSGTLPDNLAQMMWVIAGKYPAELLSSLRSQQQQRLVARSELLPGDRQRLAHLASQRLQGRYRCNSPMRSLLRDYPKLATAMTLRFYQHELQLPVSRHQLQPLATSQGIAAARQQRLASTFAGLYQDFAVLGLKGLVNNLRVSGNYRAAWQEAVRQRDAQQALSRQVVAELEQGHREMVDALLREEIQLAGLWRQWHDRPLRGSALEQVHQRAREAEDGYAQQVKAQHHLLHAHAQSLAAALVRALELHGGQEKEIQLLLDTLERIEQVASPLRELTLQAQLLELLLSYRGDVPNKRIDSRIEQRNSDVHNLLTTVGLTLKTSRNPFRSQARSNLMEYLLEGSLHGETAEAELDRALDVCTRLPQVQARIVVCLLEIARGQ